MKNESFDEYYKRYLSFHTKPGTKLMHAIGNIATVAYIIWCCYTCLWALILAPFIVYPFAWTSHWLIEGNRPAAFKNPIKAKLADWRMMFECLYCRQPDRRKH